MGVRPHFLREIPGQNQFSPFLPYSTRFSIRVNAADSFSRNFYEPTVSARLIQFVTGREGDLASLTIDFDVVHGGHNHNDGHEQQS